MIQFKTMMPVTDTLRTILLVFVLGAGIFFAPLLLLFLIIVFLPGRPPSAASFGSLVYEMDVSAPVLHLSPRSPPASF
jgi:hypothetical protein